MIYINFNDKEIKKITVALKNSIRYYDSLEKELISETLKEEISNMKTSMEETLKILEMAYTTLE